MTDKLVVYSTCASEEEAITVARALVERRLAACVAITPGVRSIYRWQDAIEESTEWGLTIKTCRNRFAELQVELRRLHTYQVPELIAVPVIEGSDDYLAWMDRELSSGLP